jgi:hypothetical protein
VIDRAAARRFVAMRAVFASVVVALLLAGCSDDGDASSTQPDPSGDGFHLRYQRSGGFAGTQDDLRVAPERRATLVSTTAGEPQTTHFRLSPRAVEGLRTAFRDAGWRRIESPGSSAGCADCFVYRIAYQGRVVRFDSVTFPKPLTPVVRRLDAIVAHH